jgi:hypothetical protein
VTDLLDQAMADAGLNLLRADTSLTVYDGAVPNPLPDVAANPYVLVYTTIEWPADDPNNALDGISGRAVVRWHCHCTGGNQQASRAVAQRVRTQLLDKRPAVAGMVPGLIRHEQDQPPIRDESLGFPVFDSVHVYRQTFDT